MALSALVVLVIAPESLMSASFHMSFAAVICLIYFYEVTRKFWMSWYKKRGWHRKFLLYFISVCMTTLIASFATAPFALYHFGQVSYLGSLANFVAVPLLAFLIMPFALLSLIAMPFGLDYWPLQIVGLGIVIYWRFPIGRRHCPRRLSMLAHGGFLLLLFWCCPPCLWFCGKAGENFVPSLLLYSPLFLFRRRYNLTF
ncbi:MAG: hypothetical protein COB14_04000 [Alphaproteobacteria bacterium]|nr:MAG: hypothetical protein COB14_04000 [Alphaproteobacteria bacterium]